MPRSIRIIFRNQKGRLSKNFNWDIIRWNTPVIVTATEWSPGNASDGNGRPLVSDHDVYVSNIGQHNPEGGPGGVEFYLHAYALAPIDVQVTVTVLDGNVSYS